MITITISINGNVVAARSAKRIMSASSGTNKYRIDTGEEIWHNEEDGAIELARHLLNTIKEV